MTYVLIDDDPLIHSLWQLAAVESAIELSCFVSVDEFLRDASGIGKDAHIYIDSNLGRGVFGEDEAHRLKDAGFKNLYIATGYDAEEVDAPDFIRDIVGKRPPF